MTDPECEQEHVKGKKAKGKQHEAERGNIKENIGHGESLDAKICIYTSMILM